MEEIAIRGAAERDIDVLAHIWFEGWQDAHADILPDALRQLRTLPSFRERLSSLLPSTRVVHSNRPLGFTILKAEELYQFYVAADARGTGVARALMADALERLEAAGLDAAWLACAIGNERAARFYEKFGWRNAGVMTSHLPTPEGPFALDVWRFEISLSRES